MFYIFVTARTAINNALRDAISGEMRSVDCGGGIGIVWRNEEIGIITMRKDASVRLHHLANAFIEPTIILLNHEQAFQNVELSVRMFLADSLDTVREIMGERIAIFPDVEAINDIFNGVKRKRRKTIIAPIVKPREITPIPTDDEEQACIVCMDNRITHLLLPCTHYQLCGVCATTMKQCPTCRQDVTGMITPIGK